MFISKNCVYFILQWSNDIEHRCWESRTFEFAFEFEFDRVRLRVGLRVGLRVEDRVRYLIKNILKNANNEKIKK